MGPRDTDALDRALARAIGEAIPATARSSILRAAFERDVPVVVPGITDGAVGSQLWLFWQDLLALKDVDAVMILMRQQMHGEEIRHGGMAQDAYVES